MRAPVDHIAAPLFPPGLEWLGARPVRIEHEQGHPLLVEFWDCCRANSIRTLPYVKEWHRRYADRGLLVVGVHTAGFEPAEDPETVREAVARLEIPHTVVIDSSREIWEAYGNLGWPARYLFNGHGMLRHYHYGEGGYEETELEIQELLELDPAPAPIEPLRAEDEPNAVLEPQSEDVAGPYSGPYRAGGVWAVLDGTGTVTANGRAVDVEHPGAYELLSHPHSTDGNLELELGPGVRCLATCFTPGVPAGATRS